MVSDAFHPNPSRFKSLAPKSRSAYEKHCWMGQDCDPSDASDSVRGAYLPAIPVQVCDLVCAHCQPVRMITVLEGNLPDSDSGPDHPMVKSSVHHRLEQVSINVHRHHITNTFDYATLSVNKVSPKSKEGCQPDHPGRQLPHDGDHCRVVCLFRHHIQRKL